MDERSLERLEYVRVARAAADRARCPAAARALAGRRPLPPAERTRENRWLAEALRREREPGGWCAVGRGDLGALLAGDGEAARAGEAPGGPLLIEIASWIEAAGETRSAWSAEEAAARFPGLAALAARLPRLEPLGARLARSLDPDGRVRDEASPALARVRAALAAGARDLEQRLERWARGFGENAYVTRHAERFVALVPAAGFPRRRAIVHDVSGSGQSLFVEPLEACEANNRLIEQAAVAAEEERRVLVELGEAVRAAAPDLLSLEATLVELDSLRARAALGRDLDAVALEPGGERLRLVAARHPLLAMSRPRERLVPLDLELEAPGRLLLVSGPNMGGKTVLLKTVGLAAALAHAGMPVPCAEGSAVPELDEILTDLGDEQSVDRGLSTFAAHVEHLAGMADRASGRTLLLCDELGAGTDPEEGGALGRALVERFAERGSWGVVTTHLGSLKLLAGAVPGVVNGSLAFDPVSLEPRFRFQPGIPGASHALAIAARLGLDAAVVARARELAPREAVALEQLLEDLHARRRALEEETAGAAAARAAAEQAAAGHRAAEEEAKRELGELRRRLTRESEALAAQARELLQEVRREARRAEKSRAGEAAARARLAEVERAAARLHADLDAAGAAGDPPAAGLDPGALAPGTRVRVRDLGIEAEIVEPPDAEGKVLLRSGSWSIHSHVERLAAAGGTTGEAPRRAAASWSTPEAAGIDVDLRGMEVAEALRSLDEGLDRGVVSGLSELRIIHGVGRGVLRAAVERHLRGHPLVASQRLGELSEGGRGVTVARLR